MSEVGAFHACKQKISDPLFNGWKSTVNSLSLQPSLHYTIFNHLAFCLLFIYTLSNMNSFWIDITVFQQFFRLFSFSLFQLLLRGCFNKMYLTEPPLHIVITFSHHFMFAYSFLARIIRVFPFISVFFFHLPAFYDIWYVCAWMLICTYINQVRAFNALFYSAFYCSSRHKKQRSKEKSTMSASWHEKCLFPLLKELYCSVTAMIIFIPPDDCKGVVRDCR